MTDNLVFLAGKEAFNTVSKEGLTPERVKIIAGAAGGPKWLVLNHLDRYLFLSWLKERRAPLHLIGSSIGAIRFSIYAQKDPVGALERFQTAYLDQRYVSKPTAEEVTRKTREILDSYLNEKEIEEILDHPSLRLNFISVRCEGLNASEKKIPLTAGLIGAYCWNRIARDHLGRFFKRALFYHPKGSPSFLGDDQFPAIKTALSRENLKPALLSSGSIPLLMKGVDTIPDLPGMFRDGGILDYHMDIPFRPQENGIVLFPHFSSRIIPGWFDKRLIRRRATPENMSNVLLVAPSARFLEKLPLGKIPDRTDFSTFFRDNDARIAYWNTVISESERLSDEFHEVVTTGKIKERVQRMTS